MQLLNSNIFDSGCDTIVNPVNVVGVMGAGLALEFKKKYPHMFEIYKHICETKTIGVGFPAILLKSDKLDKNIILFPTKEHWKNPSKIEYIKDGLENLAYLCVENYTNSIKSIAFPLLGCGLGGLSKNQVIPLIEEFVAKTGINCEIYGK
jgi:O-acetyl-ADP-ribose deacetylase (regulator of RNase III)